MTVVRPTAAFAPDSSHALQSLRGASCRSVSTAPWSPSGTVLLGLANPVEQELAPAVADQAAVDAGQVGRPRDVRAGESDVELL